ncbi:hemerythrin domain-containing protein, partial [Bacteroidales bacterium OttesenSCG-928-E04]|nr:hemerythrin domain-containing protein [Bacteroidales bacterium OttesenSCG-928-E04]
MKKIKNKDIRFALSMKMADIIDANYKLLLLFQRFDLELGFGEQTVQRTCEENKISPDLFLLVCNVYAFNDYTPQEGEIEKVNVQQFIDYLKRSHIYYKSNRLQDISDRLDAIAKEVDPVHGAILTQFFRQYKEEVLNHFDYEDEVVFPY